MQCLLEEANQFCFSLKSYQDTKIAKYFVIAKCYYIVKFVYVYQVTPSLTWIGISSFRVALTLNCWWLCWSGCLAYNIESAIKFAILGK